jgi:large subunit ribosomal protein L6e
MAKDQKKGASPKVAGKKGASPKGASPKTAPKKGASPKVATKKAAPVAKKAGAGTSKRTSRGLRGSHNRDLTKGLKLMSRSRSSSKTGKYLHTKKGGKPAAPKAVEDNMLGKWYSADDVKKPIKSRKTSRPTRLRASITPGTVVIILAGRFKGKRVVFLKQAKSGMLIVTGPYKVNGVPLRRVNQAYVIATSTKVDVSKVDVSKYDDAFFARAEKKSSKGDKFLAEEEVKGQVSAERKAAQKTVDAALLPAIKKVANLGIYLNARFTLTKNMKPHTLKF